MKSIKDLVGKVGADADTLTKGAVETLQEFDGVMTNVESNTMDFQSATMTVEKVLLGAISRVAETDCHEPTEDIPYWWLQLKMSCGGVLTLKSVEQVHLGTETKPK